jgi:hypothetical protein
VTAEFLKGLIKLTAAAIKLREDRPAGANRLAEGAIGHLESVAASTGSPAYAGLEIASAIRVAEGIRASIRAGMPHASPIVADPLILGEV